MITNVVKTLRFNELGRRMSIETVRSAFENDPMMVYYTKMNNTNELAFPLLNKVVNGKLILQDYTLDSGHCKALASSLK